MQSVMHPVSPAQRHLVEYYRAFELLLSPQRSRNELRTHFGYMPDEAVTDDYCFFKAIAAPKRYTHMTAVCSQSSDALHHRLFGEEVTPQRVLDVGFGSGGTLQRLSTDWPKATLEGINLNPVQYDIANQQLGQLPQLKLHLGDFLSYDFPARYDLLYFIES
ncbi:MAG: class I SAM-dependent methyltransferase, partial [Bacteroidota bacterium]